MWVPLKLCYRLTLGRCDEIGVEALVFGDVLEAVLNFHLLELLGVHLVKDLLKGLSLIAEIVVCGIIDLGLVA